MITKTCRSCGNQFEIHKYRQDTAFYCSQKCRQKQVEKQCATCGKEFTVKLSQSDKTICCSKSCSNIEKRRKRQRNIEEEFGEPLYTLLTRLYHLEQLGIKQIAQKLKVSDRNLWEWFNDLHIDRRDRDIAVSLQWQNNIERRSQASEVMQKLNEVWDYTGDNNPAKRRDVREKIRKSKIGSRNAMFGKFGEKNPNWKGGKITYRGKGWHGIRKQAIRRDKGRCRRCGSQRQLQVHHIVPYRDSQNNLLENLVTLCASCHMAVEYKGASWD